MSGGVDLWAPPNGLFWFNGADPNTPLYDVGNNFLVLWRLIGAASLKKGSCSFSCPHFGMIKLEQFQFCFMNFSGIASFCWAVSRNLVRAVLTSAHELHQIYLREQHHRVCRRRFDSFLSARRPLNQALLRLIIERISRSETGLAINSGGSANSAIPAHLSPGAINNPACLISWICPACRVTNKSYELFLQSTKALL